MYTKGELQIAPEDGYDYPPLEKGTIFLPHSCDQWIIGGEAEARQLLSDLIQIIMENFYKDKESGQFPSMMISATRLDTKKDK